VGGATRLLRHAGHQEGTSGERRPLLVYNRVSVYARVVRLVLFSAPDMPEPSPDEPRN
jgi:hypothetical protein